MTVKDLKIGHYYKCTSKASGFTYMFKFGGILHGQIVSANYTYLRLIKNTWELYKCKSSDGRLLNILNVSNLEEVLEYTTAKVTCQSEENPDKVVKLTIKHSLKLSFKL